MSERSSSPGPRRLGGSDTLFDLEAVLSVALTAVPEARRKLAAVIEVVAGHDRACGTQLVCTLQTYVDSDRSVADTARRLQVHRHTVVNRLAQAERIVGRPLRTGKHRYILELALLAGGGGRPGSAPK